MNGQYIIIIIIIIIIQLYPMLDNKCFSTGIQIAALQGKSLFCVQNLLETDFLL
jgi:hypothetical protein